MRSYGQAFCPISRASELFAERWTPIIVRNLLLGCTTFGQLLDGAPGLSRSVLSQRLRDLQRAGVVEARARSGGRGSDYVLTAAGRDLDSVCDALGRWGARWLETAPTDLDPGVLLWAVARSMDGDRLPDERVVVRFDVRNFRHRFWLLVERPEPELCRTPPGYDEDLVVTADAAGLARWHMGHVSTRRAIADGLLDIAGPARLVRAFASWGGQSPFPPGG